MYCPKCGKLIPEDSNFCPKCGNYINKLDDYFSYKIVITEDVNLLSRSIFLPELTSIICFATGVSSFEAHSRLTQPPPRFYMRFLNEKNAKFLSDKLTRMGYAVKIVKENQKENEDYNEKIDIVRSGAILCPRCHNTSISTGTRGFSLITGFIGSNQTVNRCAKCGYSWKP